MTRKEILHKAVDHFIVQKQEFGWDEKLLSCTYYPKKCVIGFLLPDHVAKTLLEEPIEIIYQKSWRPFLSDVGFARKLQQAHDTTADAFHGQQIVEARNKLRRHFLTICEEHKITKHPALEEFE